MRSFVSDLYLTYDPDQSWRCTDTLTGHKKAVEALCQNDKYLFSGSADSTIKVLLQLSVKFTVAEYSYNHFISAPFCIILLAIVN
jgi:WD40 repeat protein